MRATQYVLASHRLACDIERFEYRPVETRIKSSRRKSKTWKNEQDGSIAFVGRCVQVFSDKSQTFLKAVGLTFLPLQLTLLKFAESIRRLQILSSATAMAYLPVALRWKKAIKKACM